MAQCIFGHVGSISRDFADSNRALPNLHGMPFVFSHSLGQLLPYVRSEWSPKTGRSPASWTMPYGQAAQNEFFGSFRNAVSSAVESRFSTALRCGNRPN